MRCQSRDEFFEKLIPKNSICAEIGVCDGINAQRIWNITKPQFLYLIDPWETLENWWGTEHSNAEFTPARREAYHDSYLKTCEFFNDKDNVQIIKKHSTEASEDFDNFYFDWVYIDGDHRYKYVLDDLLYWDSKIKKNGFIIGHDWSHDSVQKAVKEFIQKKGYELKYTASLTHSFQSKMLGIDGHSEYLIQIK